MKQSMKILIIDDNKDITKMFTKYMTMKGNSCSVANDGRTGLNLIETETFDVIILDLAMPEFSGSDIIDTLYKNGKIKNLNIITVTASTLGSKIESTLKSKGVRLCLKKPINLNVLLGHIQQFEKIKTI